MATYPYKRLSLMMLLQYGIEGVWLPIAARYLTAPIDSGGLGFSGTQVGMLLGLATAVGAICGPFIAGQVADRHLSAERFIAFMSLVAGMARWYLACRRDFVSWFILSTLYGILYSPCMTIGNSLTFFHLTDQKRQFPLIRVWGTVGWVTASWVFPMVWLQTGLHFQIKPPFLIGTELPGVTARLGDALKFSGTGSILFGLYCLTLPHTPPQRNSRKKFAFTNALGMLRKKSFLVLLLLSLPVSVVHRIYYIQNSPFLSAIGLRDSDIMPAASVAQLGEILVMALLGRAIARLGFRWVIFGGILANFARYAVFGTIGLPIPCIVAGHLFHGFCYAWFFAAGHIYVDRIAPPDVRHSAQTFFGLFAFGVGPILGGFFSGFLTQFYSFAGPVQKFMGIWYTAAAIALTTAIVFLALFRSEKGS